MQQDIRGRNLYHHGVKGMKWGVRRSRLYSKRHSGDKEVGKTTKKTEQSSIRRNRIRKAVKATASIAGSVILTVTANRLKNNPAYQGKINAGSGFSKSYMKKNGSQKVSSIKDDARNWGDYARQVIRESEPDFHN